MQYGLKMCLVALLTLSLGACGAMTAASRVESGGPLARPPHPGAKAQDVSISRAEFERRIERGGSANEIRLVEVFNARANEGEYEYRFFDVQENSVYSLLGFQNLDVLVGCNGLVLAEAPLFWGYLLVMPNSLETPFVEIRRNGRPLVFRYRFVD